MKPNQTYFSTSILSPTPSLLILITIFTFILRFYALSTNPPSLNLDEVAIGYNAYSILHTGRDEYGQLFPSAFRSHDDYKAPLYIYLTTVPIKLFGLNAFAVRFVSALAGSLSIPVFFYLVRELFSKDKHKYLYSLIASWLLAISPWHVQFSRGAFETNLALFLVLSGFWLFLKGKSHPRLWFISAISFIASLYAYHSTKIFLPPVLFVMIIDAWDVIKKHLKLTTLLILWSLVLSLPLLLFMTKPESQLRFKGTSVFETPTLINSNRQQKIWQWREGRVGEAFLFHNDKLSSFLVILKGYFSHLTFNFLFLGEDGPPRNFTPNVGLIYLWQLPFIITGFYLLNRQPISNRRLIYSWFLAAPLISAFAWDAPSSTRTLLLLPPMIIFSSLGVVSWLSHPWGKTITSKIFLCLVIIYFFSHYLHNYYRIAPTSNADMWQYGYQQAVGYAQSQLNNYQRIVVSTNLKQPQNFFAFHSAYDPSIYINVDGGTISGGFSETRNHFGKYWFTPIDWNPSQLQDHYLYIDLAEKVPANIPILKTINLPDGTPKIAIAIKP